MSPRLIYRPLAQWTDELTKDDDRASTARFAGKERDGRTRPTPLHRTEQLLRHEAEMIGATEVIIEIDAPAAAFRADESGLRGDRRAPEFPGVVVRLIGTRFGDLRYSCDRFAQLGHGDMPSWEANLRAIALGLEALRKVERYGIARRGEQYAGWQALPPGTPMGAGGARPPLSVDEAAALLAAGIEGMTARDVLDDPGDARVAYRIAAKRLHPDNLHTGSEEAFKRLDEAWRVIRELHERTADG